MRSVVLVGGDLGRSPRTVRHAQALAAHGAQVSLVGYAGHDPGPLPGVAVHALPMAPAPPGRGLRWATGTGARFGALSIRLAATLRRLAPYDLLLVQTPPALPVLPLAQAAARAAGARLVVDWHNLQAPLLGLRLGPRHPAVRAVAQAERRLARGAALHLAVTPTLAGTLRRWGLDPVQVFADRPAEPPPVVDRPARRAALGFDPAAPLLVLATSYGPDDDLDALEAGLRAWPGPPLGLLLTGEGPRRGECLARLSRVPGLTVRWRWLPAADYPPTLAAADVGLSPHRPAAGVDFPIKIMDYRAAGLPSLALADAPVIARGLRPGDRGFVDPASFVAGLQALLAAPRPVWEGPTWAQAWAAEVAPWLTVGPLSRALHEG